MDIEFLFAFQRGTVIELKYRGGLLCQQAFLLFIDGWKYPKAAAQAQHSTAHIDNLYDKIPCRFGTSLNRLLKNISSLRHEGRP
jgi:hypothetical protein